MTKILIVDSNIRDHERYRALLPRNSGDLCLFSQGKEALACLADAQAKVDLAIVLWELQGEPTGAALVGCLRRRFPNLPVIIVSGLLDLSLAAKGRGLGAQDFLLKPLERDRLDKAVCMALRPLGESPVSGQLRSRFVGESRALMQALESLTRVIASPRETVLLVGENGTGKELMARAVYETGPEHAGPWVAVNVASVPPTLIESTLFGHEVGAFTDAKREHVGWFEESNGGVLFLDEIGDLDLALQVKLLRVIEERAFRRLGGRQDIGFTGRLVCATNRELVREVREGRFRQDLYFRISTNEIRIPPLRARREDVVSLLSYFLSKYGRKRKLRLSLETQTLLDVYPFPGNVRELESIISNAVLQCDGEEILPYHLPVAIMEQRQHVQTLLGDAESENTGKVEWPSSLFGVPLRDASQTIERMFDREYLRRKWAESRGRLRKAAELSGVDKNTFKSRWEKAGLGPLSEEG